jgi:hypothetical protein
MLGVFVVDDRSNNSKRQHQATEKGGMQKPGDNN